MLYLSIYLSLFLSFFLSFFILIPVSDRTLHSLFLHGNKRVRLDTLTHRIEWSQFAFQHWNMIAPVVTVAVTTHMRHCFFTMQLLHFCDCHFNLCVHNNNNSNSSSSSSSSSSINNNSNWQSDISDIGSQNWRALRLSSRPARL